MPPEADGNDPRLGNGPGQVAKDRLMADDRFEVVGHCAILDTVTYIRFQSAKPNAEGRHPGFFGLINNLSRAGRLTPAQEEFRRTNHAWYEARYTNPASVDPAVYDHAVNPGATAWFKASAEALVARADGYLEILEAHDVRCDKLVAHEPPGRIVYEDGDQIVVVPFGR